ncbi:MAG: hypothetical protein JWN94_4003 [Betaproteobacteria bacterium]|nr:hypothetical protein [Betaproteobacteria bacterium]
MLRATSAFIFALAALWATAPASAQRDAVVVLYEGARLIPGDGGTAIADSALLVENGTIKQVGRRGAIAPPAGAARVNLAGKTVMPALINTHAHPGFQSGLSYSRDNYVRETIVDDLNRALYFGVSTVMSQGVEFGDVMHEIRAYQRAGRLGGARLLFAGRGIGAPNAGPGGAAYAGIAYEVTTEEEIRRAVQAEAARKVNAIKIWVDDRGGRAPRLSPALSRAAIDEGHRLGLKVTAHIFYHEDAVDLATAGVNAFAHLVRDRAMDDALIALMNRNKVYVMPNIGTPERATHTAPPSWFEEPYLAAMLRDTLSPAVIERIRTSFTSRDPEVAARNRKNYAILQQSVARLAKADALIVLGSDTGLEDHIFGYVEQKELELMVAAGMSPMQVIVAATSRAAEFLELNDAGTLATGKRADFLVLDANPLDDIRNTRRIAKMYIGGQQVDRAALRTSLRIAR